ncbi:MAG: hypothetical protein N2544_15160 [Burkholderiales bacterium]|nr:hypothetical protein [Burkholderiales bacterium]
MLGGSGADRLEGSAASDTLLGGRGADVLIGAAGVDTLAGGLGDDLLVGGADGDKLYGQAGNDTYLVGAADTGVDSIHDREGRNRLVVAGQAVRLFVKDGAQWALGGLRVALGADLAISRADGTLVALIEEWRPGDFGIRLQELAPQVTPTRAILGDRVPEDLDPGQPGVQTGWDELGNVRVTGALDPERADWLYDSAGGDRIDAGGGEDWIEAARGGADSISAGGGRDYVDAGAGDDLLEGGADGDILLGGAGEDRLYAEARVELAEAFGASGEGGGERGDFLSGGEGDDILVGGAARDLIRVRAFGGANTVERIDGGAGLDLIAGTEANNVIDLSGTAVFGIARIDGGAGDDRITGSAGDDCLTGAAGDDVLRGGAGADLLQGGPGDDRLFDEAGPNLLDGGEGADTLSGGEAAEFLAGGRGDDVLKPGAGADVVAFNAGDGADVLHPGSGAGKTLSLGGRIAYADLAFSRAGRDLVLEAGGADRITLKNWYGAAVNRTVAYLQVIAAAMPGNDPGSADALAAAKTQRFDFRALVAAFDAARAAPANLARWSAMNALLDAHLGSSDDAALGGDLAYRYGLEGSLAALGTGAAREILQSPAFGAAAQQLLDAGALAAGPVRFASP